MATRVAGRLMQRAGFALPVVDTERVTGTWPDIFRLMADLRGMVAAAADHLRRHGIEDTVKRASL